MSELDAKGISGMDASVVSDFLREALVNTMKFRILERGNMEMILSEQKFQTSGCTDQECVVRMGKLLNVQKIITGSVSKLGSRYYINIRMVDVEKGEIVLADSVNTEAMEGLQPACQELANRIASGKKVESAIAPAKPPVVQPTKKAEPIVTPPVVPEKISPAKPPVVPPTKKEPEKLPPAEQRDRFGIGLHYLGGSIRYLLGVITLEGKGAFGDGFTAFGPRLYINFVRKAGIIFYLGGESIAITGKDEFQKFTGTAAGGFLGMEIFTTQNFSVLLDIGSSNITLNSEYSDINVSNNHIIGNMGVNFYF
ncbi:MAG: CsgG/HfaB family protein [Elusimicrobiota bacterium]